MTPQELKLKQKQEAEQQRREDAKRAYYDAARKFCNVPIGNAGEAKAASRMVQSATRQMRAIFGADADDLMREISYKAYRGEAL